MIFRLLQLVALWSHLSHGCNVRYTRKEMQRKLRRGSRRAARTTNLNPLFGSDNISGIRGIPGKDYPLHTVIPDTPSFSCEDRVDGGFYGDPGPESRCQVFHRCEGRDNLTKHSFLCPIGTLFQQKGLYCDLWYKVDCSTTEEFYWTQFERERSSSNVDDPNSCLTLRFWDPKGLTGGASEGASEARGCIEGPVIGRVLGFYPSLKNVPHPYEYELGFVNTCEKFCQKRDECEFYVFDCKLFSCELKMGNIDQPNNNNTRYITGRKTSKECEDESSNS